MSHDSPSLALSDIMHTMSPSPVPQDPVVQLRPKSVTPEPVQETDIERMRSRVAEMGFTGKDQENASSREMELVDMVLRLTSSTPPDPGQLLRQAETIAGLIEQRNYLVRQAEEERSRWESEKDGWARMAEALIAQRNKGGNTAAKDEELERQALSFESDNRGLREKLSDAQFRLSSLESEISKLRPLLLMQPYATTHSHPLTSIPPRTKAPVRKRKPPPAVIPAPHEGTDDEMVDELAGDDNGVQEQKKPSSSKDHYRRVQINNTIPPPPRRKKNGPKVPLMTDARTEHILLAARRIGRERAGIISGLMEKEHKRREEEAALATPKTPRRTNAAAQSHTTPRAHNHPAYVYLNSPVHPPPHGSPGAPLPVLIPAYHLLPRTPGASTSASASPTRQTQQHQKSDRQNPPTPLDSLLSAARSMMDDDTRPNANGKTRQNSDIDMPESPVPKRRKTGATASSTASVGRVKSALDVLADQAAVFSSNDGKGKGKAVDPPRRQSADSTNMSTRSSTAVPGKGKGKGRGKGKSKTSGAIPPSPTSAAKATTDGHHVRMISPPGSNWENGGSRPFQPSPSFKGSLRPVSRWKEDGPSSDREEAGGDIAKALDSSTPQASTSAPTTTPTAPTGQNQGDVDMEAVENQDLPSAPPPPPPLPQASSSSESISQQPPEPTSASTSSDPAVLPRALAPPIALSRSHSEERVNGNRRYDPLSETGIIRRAVSIPPHRSSPLDSDVGMNAHARHETAPSHFNLGGPKQPDLDRVAGQEMTMQMGMGMLGIPTKRPRSPYVKWSKEEDDLLAQAVAKYGQKWDLVQKALPSRGYHQVRQRWLRKLGVFDPKPDLSAFQSNSYSSSPSDTNGSTTVAAPGAPFPNPKLGMAPLSSELGYSGFPGRPSGSGEAGTES